MVAIQDEHGTPDSPSLDSLARRIDEGQLQLAEQEAIELWALLDRDDERERATCLALRGVIASRERRWLAADELLGEATELAEAAGMQALAFNARVDRILPMARAGNPEGARLLLHDVHERLHQHPTQMDLVADIEARLGATGAASASIALSADLQLVWETPRGEECQHPLSGTRIVIGRRRDSDVQINWDAEVSRRHCVLELRGGGWHLIDYSSHASSRVEGCREQTGPLVPGAIVHVGLTPFRVEPAT